MPCSTATNPKPPHTAIGITTALRDRTRLGAAPCLVPATGHDVLGTTIDRQHRTRHQH